MSRGENLGTSVDSQKEDLLKIFSLKLRNILSRLEIDFHKLQEIRLRINAPLLIIYQNKESFISQDAKLTTNVSEAMRITRNEIRETMEYISNYSLYAFEEEIKQGFITITGGHRVGISGKTVIEQNKVKYMKHISFINIRMSHQITGCAGKVLPYLVKNQTQIYNSLIISPPRCGKTTLLRDLIRQISNGTSYCRGQCVGVVDERSEIAACYMGEPQNDLGIRTDVLDCCPKASGMMMLIRSMSPEVIAVDEIGSKEDLEAVENVIRCGCSVIATVHGGSIRDLEEKPVLSDLMRRKYFERYIILNNKNGVGSLEHIYDSLVKIIL